MKAMAHLPDTIAMKQLVLYHRNEQVLSTNPTDLFFESILKNVRYCIHNKQFLLLDSGLSFDRIIINGTVKQLRILKQSKELYMDDAFCITPSIFFQLYTTHVIEILT
ncbi:unnamed protein product [Didymodactylos carnosus]|uniref:Uncharacterized protein n=1 Tax=Didymodactylos carnosus TaxID=1234261 RepID=A0A814DCS1_9BILA|nr:unnamed protein product [Didymodactylos carnosus]CAF3726973.1 unnamed protein product [Didymodactylos carnosus]